jgi:uncharacterized BrkB/YihY/UPF0761 family membrane protein
MRLTMSAEATDAAATTLTDTHNESERTRSRRRRRRTPAERNAFRFRAALLGIVLLVLLITLIGDNFGRGLHHLLDNFRSSSLSRFLQHNIRWETVILAIVAVGLLILMVPDAEDKILRAIGLRKKK